MASYNIVGRVDLKPLQKASKAFEKFDKQTQFWAKRSRAAYLAVSAAATYYAQRLARESVNAALADEKSQRQLAFTLQQVAGANDAAAVSAEVNIATMSRMYGIADDQLRPALATLARVTGSTTTALSGLDLALSLSVATGRDLNAVTAALSRAYNGNLTSLKRLNLRLDENKVKNKDINGIINDLRKTYGAFATNELNTTANQLNRIKVAAGEASEIVGISLVDSIVKLIGTQNGVNNLSKSFEDIAYYIADVVSGATELISIYKKLKVSVNLVGNETIRQNKFNTSILGLIRLIGKEQRINASVQKNITKQVISARNAEMTALKVKKEANNEAIIGEKKTLEQLMAEEAARKAGFKITEDIDSIQTVAAAKRLAEAREYKFAVIEAAQAQYDSLKSNYENLNKLWETQKGNWKTFQELVEKGLSVNVALKIAGIIPQGGNPPVGQAVTNQGSYLGFEDPLSLSMGANQGSVAGGTTNVNVTINAGAVGQKDFLIGEIGNAVAEYIRVGNSIVPAGFTQ